MEINLFRTILTENVRIIRNPYMPRNIILYNQATIIHINVCVKMVSARRGKRAMHAVQKDTAPIY